MHGLFMNLPTDHLKRFAVGDKMGKALAEKVKNGDIVFNWLAYAQKFGFCNVEAIKTHEGVAKYVTKYISKNLEDSVTEINAQKYYRSNGLREAETIKKGTLPLQLKSLCKEEKDYYKGEYSETVWLDYSDELYEELKNSFLKG
jgi:hypothetical protein